MPRADLTADPGIVPRTSLQIVSSNMRPPPEVPSQSTDRAIPQPRCTRRMNTVHAPMRDRMEPVVLTQYQVVPASAGNVWPRPGAKTPALSC
jgi:hypothetical protein